MVCVLALMSSSSSSPMTTRRAQSVKGVPWLHAQPVLGLTDLLHMRNFIVGLNLLVTVILAAVPPHAILLAPMSMTGVTIGAADCLAAMICTQMTLSLPLVTVSLVVVLVKAAGTLLLSVMSTDGTPEMVPALIG